MKISKLVELLQKVKDENGDIDVTLEVAKLEFQDINDLKVANYKGEEEFVILTDKKY